MRRGRVIASSRLREFPPHNYVCAFGFNPLVVQFALGDRKYLTRAVDDQVAILPDDKRSRDHEPADREMMSMPPLTGTRSKLLRFDLGKAVLSQLLFEVVFIHASSPGFMGHLDQAPASNRVIRFHQCECHALRTGALQPSLYNNPKMI